MSFALKSEYLPQYTYDDYCRWEGNWELIEGVPYAMSPMPSIRHQEVAGNIYAMLSSQLKTCKDCKALLPIDWKIKENTVVQPDISVICKPETNNNYLTFPPTLIFEIISPSSIVRDRNIKFSLYQSEKVKYYVLIDVQREMAEVFELKGEEYIKAVQTHDQGYTFHLDNNCSVQVPFAEVWG